MLWIPDAFDKARKMRFKPWWWLFLLAWAVVIAYVVMVSSTLRQNDERDDVLRQLGSGMTVLAKADDVRQNVEDLPGRLTEARRELTAAQIVFPGELNSNNVLKAVIELAGESSVDVRSVETSSPVAEPTDAESPAADPTEGTGGTGTLTYAMEVEGDFGQLMTFLEALEEGATGTTRVSTFTLQQADGRYLLDFELIAHARPTASEGSAPAENSTADEGAEPSSDGQETARE